MTDATTKLFQELAEPGYEPALEKATGTLRFTSGTAARALGPLADHDRPEPSA